MHPIFLRMEQKKRIYNLLDDSSSRFRTSFHVIYDQIMPAISHYHTHASLGNRFYPPTPRPFRGHFPAGITAELSTPVPLPLTPFFFRPVDETMTTTTTMTLFSALLYTASRQPVEVRSLTRSASPSLWRTSAATVRVSGCRRKMRRPIAARKCISFPASYFEPRYRIITDKYRCAVRRGFFSFYSRECVFKDLAEGFVVFGFWFWSK